MKRIQPEKDITKLLSKNMLNDSILLSIVQIITIFVGIIQTMILARVLTKTLYGTYAQSMMVHSFFSPLLSLGLGGSINYFYNRTTDLLEKKKYVNTIFLLSTISGCLGALLLIISRELIASYFSNIELIPLVYFISIRPLFTNLIALYLPLYVSSGFTKIIALRNLMVSIFQVTLVYLVSFYIRNLIVLIIVFLLLDVLQFIIFSLIYRKKCFSINLVNIDLSLFKPILKFSFPMLLSMLLGTISINLDKLIIGKLMSTEDFALYSNMSKELPFSFVAASLTTVITPQIVKYLHRGDMNSFKRLWGDYLEVGYFVTWTLIIGLFFISPELIKLLYSQKYLDSTGVIVFRLYLIVAAFRFTYFGMIPSALGKTKVILRYTFIAITINIILNYPFFYILGMIGPAISTIISMLISAILYFSHSLKLVHLKFLDVISLKNVIQLFLIYCLGITIQLIAYNYLKKYVDSSIILLAVGYSIFIIVVLLCRKKNIKRLFQDFKKYS